MTIPRPILAVATAILGCLACAAPAARAAGPAAEDVRRVTAWVVESRELTSDDVAALERRLAESGGADLEARAKLWSHYASVRFERDPDPQRLARYREHTLWVAENAPGSALAHHPTLWPSVPPTAFADDRAASRFPTLPILVEAMGAWERALTRHPDDLGVRFNAARFFSLPDPARARELLEGGLVADREDSDWPRELGALHDRMARRGGEEGFSYLRAYAFHGIARDRADDPSLRERFEVRMAESALASGDASAAAAHARAALGRIEAIDDEDARGQVVHDANLVLGHAALRNGNVAEAGRHLREAGTTGGSGVLGSFGPDLELADALLRAGERDAVLAYLEECARFWPSGRERVEGWIAAIRAGDAPKLERRSR